MYRIDEVSERVGLTPHTIRGYLRNGQSDLVRGRDFIVRRRNSARRNYMITDYGLERLTLGQYRVLSWRPGRKHPTVEGQDYGRPRLRLTGPRSERIAMLIAVMYDAMTRYQETPCAVPNCPCIIHKLGVPQADVVQVIMKRDGWVDAFGRFHRFNDYQRRDTDK